MFLVAASVAMLLLLAVLTAMPPIVLLALLPMAVLAGAAAHCLRRAWSGDPSHDDGPGCASSTAASRVRRHRGASRYRHRPPHRHHPALLT